MGSLCSWSGHGPRSGSPSPPTLSQTQRVSSVPGPQMLLRGCLWPSQMSPWGRCSRGHRPGWQMAPIFQRAASAQPRAARQGGPVPTRPLVRCTRYRTAPGSLGVGTPPPRHTNHLALRFQVGFVKGESIPGEKFSDTKTICGLLAAQPPAAQGPSRSPIRNTLRGLSTSGWPTSGAGSLWVLQTPTSHIQYQQQPSPTCDNQNVPRQAEATTLTPRNCNPALSGGLGDASRCREASALCPAVPGAAPEPVPAPSIPPVTHQLLRCPGSPSVGQAPRVRSRLEPGRE